jgi:uncharacterized membrane protein YdjX (TVP38/TMEM64 family)
MAGASTQEGISLKKLVPLLVILVIAVVGFFTLRDYLTFETLRDNREQLLAWRDSNYLLVALGFIVGYIVIVAFSLPGAAVTSITGGFLFSVFPGVIFNVAAAAFGAHIIFLAAKSGLGDYLSKKMETSDGAISQINAGLHENEVSYLFIMRLVPVVPFFVANLVPALFGVKLRNFTFTTVFGIIPGGLVYTWVGAGLGEVFALGETPDFGIIFEWQILGPILGLVALSALPIVINTFKKRKQAGC